MSRRFQLGVAGVCFFAGIVLCVHAAQAGKPIPCGKDAPTEATWRAELYARHQQDVALYKKLTQDPQAIREKAARFLDDYFKRAYLMPKAPSWDDLETQGEQLSAQGAKDPLFQTIFSLVNARVGKANESVQNAKAAYQKMASAKYPASLQLLSCTSWYNSSAPNPAFADDAKASRKEIVAAILKAAEETADQPKEQKFIFDTIYDIVSNSEIGKPPEGGALRSEIYDAVEKTEKIHPWLKNMLLGYKYDLLAWQSRGAATANRVSEGGWRGFKENSQKAADHFTKAWELDPTVPYAAVGMIGVAGGSGIGGLSARDWFDRAVEARMDYYFAYSGLANFLQPKWGGREDSIREFGRECIATKRFDTDVPFKFILLLHFVDREMGDCGAIWLQEGTYDSAKTVLEGMENEPARSAESLERRPPEWLLSLHAALAAKVKKYGEARPILDQLGPNLRMDALDFVKCRHPIEIARVYAMTGEGRADVKKYEATLADYQLSDPAIARSAKECLENAIRTNSEPEAKPYFDQQKTLLAWLQQFYRGEWVNLTFDPSLSMWEQRAGNWTCVDSQSVISHEMPFGKPNRLVSVVPFSGPLEIDLDAAGLNYTKGYQCGVGIGDIWATSGDANGCLFWFSPRWRLSGVSVPNNKNHNVFTEIDYTAHFRIQAWEGAFCFYAHSTEHPPVELEGLTLGDNHIELTTTGINGEMAGDARFSNIRIRKLTAPAPPMGNDADRVGYFDKLIKKTPNDAFLYYQRGRARSHVQRLKEAAADFKKSLELSPDFPIARLAWSETAYRLGDVKTAIDQLDEYLKVKPDDLYAIDAKVWFLSTCADGKFRDGKMAVQLAEKECKTCQFQNYSALETLASADAEVGNFDDAVKWAEEALKLATPNVKQRIQSRIELYQSKRPLRFPVPKAETKPAGKG